MFTIVSGITPPTGPGNANSRDESCSATTFSFNLGQKEADAFALDFKSIASYHLWRYYRFGDIHSLGTLKEAFIRVKAVPNTNRKLDKNSLTLPLIMALPKIIEGKPDTNDLMAIDCLRRSARVNCAPLILESREKKKVFMLYSILPIIALCKAKAGCNQEQANLKDFLDEEINHSLRSIHMFTCHIKDNQGQPPRSIRDWIVEILSDYLKLSMSQEERTTIQDLVDIVKDQKQYDAIVLQEDVPACLSSASPSIQVHEPANTFNALGQFRRRVDANFHDIFDALCDDLALILGTQRSRFGSSFTAFDRLEADYAGSNKSNIYFNMSGLSEKFYESFFENLLDSDIVNGKKYMLLNIKLIPGIRNFIQCMLSMSDINGQVVNQEINNFFNDNQEQNDDFRIFLGRRLKASNSDRDFETVLNNPQCVKLFTYLGYIKQLQLKLKQDIKILIFDRDPRSSLLDHESNMIVLDESPSFRSKNEDDFYKVKVESDLGSASIGGYSLASVLNSMPESKAIEYLNLRDADLISKLKAYDKLFFHTASICANLCVMAVSEPGWRSVDVKHIYDAGLYFKDVDDDGGDDIKDDTPDASGFGKSDEVVDPRLLTV